MQCCVMGERGRPGCGGGVPRWVPPSSGVECRWVPGSKNVDWVCCGCVSLCGSVCAPVVLWWVWGSVCVPVVTRGGLVAPSGGSVWILILVYDLSWSNLDQPRWCVCRPVGLPVLEGPPYVSTHMRLRVCLTK